MAKAKKKGGSSKSARAPVPAGQNRRAMAVLTHNLARELEGIDEKIALLNKQKKNRFDQYKKDTGRSKRAAAKAMAYMKMEDTVARQTELNDFGEIMEDLGMMDAGLFKQASANAGFAADMIREQSTPGFIEGLGRQAFKDGKKFEEHGYPSDGPDTLLAIEKWQRGFHAAQKQKEEDDWNKEEDAKRAKAAKEKAVASSSEAKH